MESQAQCDFLNTVKEEEEEKKELKSVYNFDAQSMIQDGHNHIANHNDARSVSGLDLSARKLLNKEAALSVDVWTTTDNSNTRPMTVPLSGPNATLTLPSQLTMFYNGIISVFDAISTEKAHEIMLFAAATAAATNPGKAKNAGIDCPASSPALTRSPSLQSTAAALTSPETHLYPNQENTSNKLKAGSEFPIARRRSLQQFFEKRRDRLVSKNPYPAATTKKANEDMKTSLAAETSPVASCLELN